jgi:hypothetical protein
MPAVHCLDYLQGPRFDYKSSTQSSANQATHLIHPTRTPPRSSRFAFLHVYTQHPLQPPLPPKHLLPPSLNPIISSISCAHCGRFLSTSTKMLIAVPSNAEDARIYTPRPNNVPAFPTPDPFALCESSRLLLDSRDLTWCVPSPLLFFSPFPFHVPFALHSLSYPLLSLLCLFLLLCAYTEVLYGHPAPPRAIVCTSSSHNTRRTAPSVLPSPDLASLMLYHAHTRKIAPTHTIPRPLKLQYSHLQNAVLALSRALFRLLP